jgi:hypothetical protein
MKRPAARDQARTVQLKEAVHTRPPLSKKKPKAVHISSRSSPSETEGTATGRTTNTHLSMGSHQRYHPELHFGVDALLIAAGDDGGEGEGGMRSA